MGSYARRMRRAAMQGKRPQDITYKERNGGRAPIYSAANYTAEPKLIRVNGYGVTSMLPTKGKSNGNRQKDTRKE